MNARPIAVALLALLLVGCGDEKLEKVEARKRGAEEVVDKGAILTALGAHVRARRASASFRGLEREWLLGDGGWSHEDIALLDTVLHQERLARRLLQQAMGEERWTLEEAEEQPVGKEWAARAHVVKMVAEAFEAGMPERALKLVRETD